MINIRQSFNRSIARGLIEQAKSGGVRETPHTSLIISCLCSVGVLQYDAFCNKFVVKDHRKADFLLQPTINPKEWMNNEQS